jgi:hypothetical protein|tara:strand:+ start:188 stop:427 length:240 start_codon:yes stop_codon:yes gene_type:complete
MYVVTMIGVLFFQRVFARQLRDRDQDVNERRVCYSWPKKWAHSYLQPKERGVHRRFRGEQQTPESGRKLRDASALAVGA